MVTKVRGAFNEFGGTADLDGANPENSRVQVTIEAASIDTRNAQRDEHLRSNDFLAMQEYPKITFVSTGVRQAGETTFEVTGDLTIKGVTQSITIPFEFDSFASECILEGLDDVALTLRREDAITAYEASHEPRVRTTALA